MKNYVVGVSRLATWLLTRRGLVWTTSLLLAGSLAGCNAAAPSSSSSASARTALVGMVHSQENMYRQKQRFATAIETLLVEKPKSSDWVVAYQNNADGDAYRVEVQPKAVFITAESTTRSLKKLVGATFVVGATGELKSILCEAKELGDKPLAYPLNSDTCGATANQLPI
jgi:Type IV pilin-like G and H, putative